MTIDKYTKFILTLIAVGVIGINFHLYSGNFVKEAKAQVNPIDIMIMKDELMEEIIYSRQSLNSRLNNIEKELGRSLGGIALLVTALAKEGHDISDEAFDRIIEKVQNFN